MCNTLEAKEEVYRQLMQKGKQLVAMAPEGQDSNTEQDLRNLEEKWESVQGKVAERKVKSGNWTLVALKGKNTYFPHRRPIWL